METDFREYATPIVATSVVPNTTVPHDGHEEFYHTSQFITGIILYPVVITVGLVGNVVTLVVLSHRKMCTSTNTFLKALAVADIIKLLNDTLYFVVSILLRRHPAAGNKMLGYMYPFSHYVFNEAVCVSAWLTVSVAVERYLSVCHSTRARVVCTVERACIISVTVFVIMSLVAVPSALRYTRNTVVNPQTNGTQFEIVLTELGRNEQFMKGYTWIQNLLRSIMPLFVLIVLNTLIIQVLRKERVKGKKMSSRNRITFMLIIVILDFIICIFPDAIMSTVFGLGYVDENFLVKGIREFTDLLLSINSAMNFLIYCMCSKGFRDVFKEIFCKYSFSPDRMNMEEGSPILQRDNKVLQASPQNRNFDANCVPKPHSGCKTNSPQHNYNFNATSASNDAQSRKP